MITSFNGTDLEDTGEMIPKTNINFDIKDLHRNDNGFVRNPYYSYKYNEIYKKSMEHPEEFWAQVGQQLTWSKPWKKVLDNSNQPFTKWFVGGELNACYNAIDRHVESGKGHKIALIHDSPMTNAVRKVTYGELLNKVSHLAGALAKFGVTKGDRVIIYMPLIPETVMAMLAVVRLGAVHSVVFGGFAAPELAHRIEHARPKVIIAANCGLEPNKIIKYKDILNKAIAWCSFKPAKCVIFQRRNIETAALDKDMDILWEDALSLAGPHPCVPVEANDPLYILYTSGTTNKPKGVQRPVGGHLATLAWTMWNVYGMGPEDVWWAASDLGWVVGHSYICYGPLLYGITSVMYEGKPDRTPDPGQYFRIIEQHGVNALFTVPTSFRVIKREDPTIRFGRNYDTKTLRSIFVAGEHLDYETKRWAQHTFEVPVLNHWWQTETGHAITATCVGLDQHLDPPKFSTGMPFPGYDVRVLTSRGKEAKPNELGRLVIKLPLPPGTMSTLYQAPEQFCKIYFTEYPGYYDTMDAGYIDDFGYVYVTARDDDIINVAGHRISTAAIEDVIMAHPDVTDTAVVGVHESTKGEIPLCLFILRKDTLKTPNCIHNELVTMVRDTIGPIAAFHLSVAVEQLPRTRSGKTCRKQISDLANDKLLKISPSVENPLAFKDIVEGLQKIGYARNVPPNFFL
ncbi:hypothetical protein PPYR_05337 [Photinus pyralis]|uniref:Acyl-CoA synthetase short-chain family member 3, mitochondrial n=1 Tax=Photinus pyralis TaxID=7054 RepID=A0A1Y1K7K9_PHOPY|nr:acyl-CoA synthetase short-chain family member 3, mitochondrial [Photinus pyralis]KAB0800983.1 hypothetical protein PPYR_05337 [Photinus pyralis]